MQRSFSYYLGILGTMATHLDTANQELTLVAGVADGPARVAADATGIIGAKAGFPGQYNSACDAMRDRASKGAAAYLTGAQQLVETERTYAANDDYWAWKFGLMNDGKDPKIPQVGEAGKEAKLP